MYELTKMSILMRVGLLKNKGHRISYSASTFCVRNYASLSSVKRQSSASTVENVVHDPHQHADLKTVNEVPGPRRFPLVGSFLSMLLDKDFDRKNINRYWRKLNETYGDIVRMDLPGLGPMIMVYKPEDGQNLARVTLKNPIRDGGRSLKKIRLENIDNYFENKTGLIASNNEEWWDVRSRVQTPMMKPKNVTAYMTQMDQVALDFLDKIAEFQKDLGEMPKDFLTEMYKWALESVSLVALNRRLGCLDSNLPADSEPMILIREANNMLEAMNRTELGPQLWRFFPTPAYLAMKRSHNTFLKIVDANIRKAEEILFAKDPQSNEELTLMETLLLTPGLTRKDVVTLIIDMTFAGIDTTSNTSAFTLYLLAKNPRVQKKVQDEIDSVLGDSEGPLNPNHLAKLSYLKMVVKETMRMYPLTPGVFRTLVDDAVFCGHLIPKGYIVASANVTMCEDERIFDKPKEFIPERWSRDRPHGDFHPFAALPFGVGTRMCIGRRIAEQDMYTFLTRCLQRFNVDYKYGEMGVHTRLISTPSEPLRFNFKERR